MADAWLQSGGSGDSDLLTAAADAYSQLASHQSENGNFEPAVASAKRSLDLQERARKLKPEDEKLLRAVAIRYWAVGAAQKVAGHPEEAVASFTTTVELMRQVAERNQGNAQSRRELLAASWLLAASTENLLKKQKKGLEEALPLWQQAWESGTQLLAEDPANALVEADVALISHGLGSALQAAGRPRDALNVISPAAARQERRYLSAPENRTAAYYLALLDMDSASCRKDLHDLPAALRDRRAAMRLFDRLVAASPENYDYRHDKATNLKETGEVMATLGDYSGARALYREGLEIAEGLPKGPALQDPAPLIADLRAADLRAASIAH